MKKCLGCFKDINDELEICPFCGYIVGTEAEEAIHLVPGTMLSNRYIIGKVIGYGGFGVTYIAWDTTLEMRVAIKEYLPSEFSTRMPGIPKVTVFTGEKSEQFNDGLNKFVEEAMKLVRFQNEEGIVKVYDCIKENGTAYIIMEYLEGCTLDVYLKEKKTIPEDEAIALLMPIMLSLQTVHDDGILHRDIAPENIFITNDGKSKLIDFGASRFATTSHSRSLTVIVKPGYSPEEQYRSRGDQGPHTDVYSIAATLYKAITGTTPPDALERRAKVETTKRDIIVDPRRINKNISLRCENAIMNALNVQIEDRTKDIQQFISELNSDEPVARRYGKIKKTDFYRWPLWLKIAAPTLLALIVLFGVLIITGVIHFDNPFSSKVNVPDGYVLVPNVLNMSTEDAYKVIEESGLQHSIGGTLANPYQEINTIIYQSPESEKYALRNSVLSLTICEGDGSDMMLIYKESGDIMEFLSQNGIDYEIVEEYNDSVDEGLISKVTLDDGTEILSDSQIPSGKKAILYISKGPKPFPMPDLYGMTLEEAQAKLTEYGLVLDVTNVGYEKSEALEPGHILKQSVAANTDVKKGTSVSVTLVAEEELIEVVSVVNKNKDDAKKALEDQGFKVIVSEENSDTVPEGTVISQTPAGGTSQKEKSNIYIIVSKGPKDPSGATSNPTETAATETAAPTATPVPTEAPATPTPTEIPATTPAPSEESETSDTTPTDEPTAAPTTPTPAPTLTLISDQEIHRENGETSVAVSTTVTSGYTVDWSSSNTDILTVSASGSSATLTSSQRGTVTVTATISGTDISQSFTVRCYDTVYGDWGEKKYSLSPITESDTRQACGDENVVTSEQWYVKMDYYLYGDSSGNRHYSHTTLSGYTLRWHFLTDDGHYKVEASNDGGSSPASGYTAIASGGWSSGQYRGKNDSSKTGYANSSGAILFVVDKYSEKTYEHRYYYQDRSKNVSCE